jgi:hypothetical protein
MKIVIEIFQANGFELNIVCDYLKQKTYFVLATGIRP